MFRFLRDIHIFINMEHYVYIYLDQRKPGKWVFEELTFDYEPFYVGVGVNRRINQHLSPKSRSDNSIKSNIINKIISETGEIPLHYKIYENLNNEVAYEYEKSLIIHFGRRNLNNGPLSNMTDGGENGTFNTVVSDETRKKMSDKAKGTKRYDKNGMSKIVEQYTLDGVLLNTFSSLIEASEFIGKSFKTLSRCCRGETQTSHGYKWKYAGKSYNPPIKPEVKSRRKRVYQYDLEGKYVGEYESQSEAVRITKIGHISCVCLGKLNFSGGYQWRYEKLDKLPPLTFEKTNNINRYI